MAEARWQHTTVSRSLALCGRMPAEANETRGFPYVLQTSRCRRRLGGMNKCPECGKTIQMMGGVTLKSCPFCKCDFTPYLDGTKPLPNGSRRPCAPPRLPAPRKPPRAPAAPGAPKAARSLRKPPTRKRARCQAALQGTSAVDQGREVVREPGSTRDLARDKREMLLTMHE